MRPHSEQRACPRNETNEAAVAALRTRQAEKASEGIWDAEQLDRHWTSRWGTLIARQPFGPGQAPMRVAPRGTGVELRREGEEDLPAPPGHSPVGLALALCKHAALCDGSSPARAGALHLR
jgi:hypothetical protein